MVKCISTWSVVLSAQTVLQGYASSGPFVDVSVMALSDADYFHPVEHEIQ